MLAKQTAPPSYLRRVWRWKWRGLALALLIIICGVLFTYRQPRVYEAAALLAFSNRSSGAFRADVTGPVTASFINSQITLIRHPRFLYVSWARRCV